MNILSLAWNETLILKIGEKSSMNFVIIKKQASSLETEGKLGNRG